VVLVDNPIIGEDKNTGDLGSIERALQAPISVASTVLTVLREVWTDRRLNIPVSNRNGVSCVVDWGGVKYVCVVT
jgi:hypothetical protein